MLNSVPASARRTSDSIPPPAPFDDDNPAPASAPALRQGGPEPLTPTPVTPAANDAPPAQQMTDHDAQTTACDKCCDCCVVMCTCLWCCCDAAKT
jgi:hypothetical protein